MSRIKCAYQVASDQPLEEQQTCPCCAGLNRRMALRALLGAGLALPTLGFAHAAPALLAPRLTLQPLDHAQRRVALTLDACPGGFDVRILQALIDWQVPATLFLTGSWINHHPDAVRVILQHPNLFAIGNHGAHHVPAVLGSRSIFGLRVAGTLESVRAEILNGQEAIRKATGVSPRWYRGATALYSPEVIPMIAELGFSVAGFSINGDEGATLSASGVTERLRRARDGDVIIAHINQPHRSSGAGVVAGVCALLDQNVQFVRLDDFVPSVVAL